jgi:ankyrin repeat protein
MSGYQSPVYALLDGLMPIVIKTDNSETRVCCEAWAAKPWQYHWGSGQDRKKCTCKTARVAASKAALKIAQINRSHICTSVGILHLASYLGMLEVVELCFELGVDINQCHESFGSALLAAIKGGSLEAVALLLQHHIDVNLTSSEHETPLYLACKTRNMELLQLILQHGTFVDHAIPTTGTALHMACQIGDCETAEILLRHSARTDVLIPGKGTPLHVACERQDEAMLKLLLTYGADTDLISPELGAVLHTACRSHSSGLVKLLLEHGANADLFSANHGTPLHTPYKDYGSEAIIQLLLKHGADVNSKGSNGETPLTLMLSKDHSDLTMQSIGALFKSEQRLHVTEDDLERLVPICMTEGPGIKVCERVLKDNPHLQPTIKTIRSVVAGLRHTKSDILRMLLGRAMSYKLSKIRFSWRSKDTASSLRPM